MKQIIIIGGGAAGFFSAIWCKETNPDASVTIIEKSKYILSKVLISGGGRCNVTHACFEPKALCENYPRGARELRGPMSRFQPKDTIDWFKSRGVSLKVEGDNRVFPVSDSSQSIYDCLVSTAKKYNIAIWTECTVNAVKKTSEGFQLNLQHQTISCDKLILATGSSRGGFELAKQLGHTIIDPIPSLFTFKINDPTLKDLQGLSVPDCTAWLNHHKKGAQSGPLLITHWGMSGPAIIKLSAWQARLLYDNHYQLPLTVNWLPEESSQSLIDTVNTQINRHPKRALATYSPFTDIPKRLWVYLLQKSGINGDITWNQLSPKSTQRLLQTLQSDCYQISGKGTFKEEFVTCGGISLKEIDFKSMESKLVPDLHCVGELLDIDGITGGFNFQNAWTTGFLAGTYDNKSTH